MASDDPQKLARMVPRLKDEVEREVNDRLPRKMGLIAVQHFKQNFRDSGLRDGGLRPWKGWIATAKMHKREANHN